MAVASLENGKTTICMDKACIHGQMAVDTKDNIKMIANMAKVFTLGQITVSTQANGTMANNMALVCIKVEKKAMSGVQVFGTMESAVNGVIETHQKQVNS